MGSSVIDQIVLDVSDKLQDDDRWNLFAKQTERREREFLPLLKDLWDQQWESVRREMQRTPPRWIKSAESDNYGYTIFKPEEWAVTFKAAEMPFTEETMRQAGQRTIDALVVGIDFDVTNPRVQGLIEEKAFKFAREVNETTLRQLRRNLAISIDQGEGIYQIRNRIKDVFDIEENYRAEMIARTEVIGTNNRAAFEGYRQSGVVETKRWIATRDDRTRDKHKAMDGEEVPLDGRFSNGLDHPGDWNGPAEEIINCRCALGAGRLKEAA